MTPFSRLGAPGEPYEMTPEHFFKALGLSCKGVCAVEEWIPHVESLKRFHAPSASAAKSAQRWSQRCPHPSTQRIRRFYRLRAYANSVFWTVWRASTLTKIRTDAGISLEDLEAQTAIPVLFFAMLEALGDSMSARQLLDASGCYLRISAGILHGEPRVAAKRAERARMCKFLRTLPELHNLEQNATVFLLERLHRCVRRQDAAEASCA